VTKQDINDTLIILEMLDSGIVPYRWPRNSLINDGLTSLNEHDSRKAKRKFRKLWRKALKYYAYDEAVLKNLQRLCGVGLKKSELKFHHYIERSRLVYRMLENRVQD
tara:strand:+ start:872 stop:1192 length:321 start_codon:yes stop_codon:yes gene_type:complete